MNSIHFIKYLLQLADNELILGHRLSEWCGHGPVLEHDIAITNIALDHIGQCRYLYDIAAAAINALSPEEKSALFESIQLKEKCAAGEIDQDDLAYLRDGWEFRNILLVEQPNGDWAHTIARSYFYDVFMSYFYTALKQSNHEELSAIAEKSLKEVEYHKKWSGDWILRLGDGTEESHRRLQEAVNNIWNYTGEMFDVTDVESEALKSLGLGMPEEFYPQWFEEVQNLLSKATLNNLDKNAWMHKGGKSGHHTEHLGYILTELQYMQRTYPNMKW